ncbi:MAG TPA: TIGR02253 family HAD-type hydrolase [Planctomycetota bacterium]|nr:TIGR02253 family HAD-type hydrolase [Planctomycetota bacterium]HRU51449.1 TIGR02253 family HAD-type hydrolase [Planctomycetota bacterium]
MTKPLQAIFFDVDDTLCATTEFTQQARKDAIQAMINYGLNLPHEYLYNELQEVIQEFSSNYTQHFDQLLLRIPTHTYQNINKAILIAAAVAAYHDAKHCYLKPHPDVQRFLEYLEPMPIIKGVITQGFAIKQAEKLIRLNIYTYLDCNAIFITDQIGISKSNPKIYTHTCQKCNIQPEQTIYIGDNPIHDIDTANKAGLITVRVYRGKYKDKNGETQAHYEIQNLDQLQTILQQDFTCVAK